MTHLTDGAVLLAILIAQACLGGNECHQSSVLGIAQQRAHALAPPFACELDVAHHDATGAKDACQLLLGSQQVGVFQLIVGDAEGFEQLAQGTLVVLRHGTFLSEQSQSLAGLLVDFCQCGFLRCASSVYLVNE